jgi:protein TonB
MIAAPRGFARDHWLPALVSLILHGLIFCYLSNNQHKCPHQPPRILRMIMEMPGTHGDPAKRPGTPGDNGGGKPGPAGNDASKVAQNGNDRPSLARAAVPRPVSPPSPRAVLAALRPSPHPPPSETPKPTPKPVPKRRRKPKAVPRPVPIADDVDRPARAPARTVSPPVWGRPPASGARSFGSAPAGSRVAPWARAGTGGAGGRHGQPGGGGRGVPGGNGGGGSGTSGAHLVGFQRPTYPADARARNEEGRVVLEVQVSAAGLAVEVTVAQSSGSASLDRAATNGVRRAHFQPARQGGLPIDGRARVTVVFRLDS